MITFKRAVTAAAFLLTMLFLINRSHSIEPTPLKPSSQDEQLEMASSTLQTPDLHSTATVTQPEKNRIQIPLQDMSHASLQDKLAYQFPYDVEAKFPAYIWQTWRATPASGNFGDEFRDSEASWTELHPTFIHEVITDDVAVYFLRHLYASLPEVVEAYTALPMIVLKADFFRYLILLARGGVYSDIDTMALRPILEWIPEHVPNNAIGLVVGIEADPDRPDWAEWYARRIQFCQWTIQAKAGHPVLREVVANITLETLKAKQRGRLTELKDRNVIEFTGPGLWTDAIFNYMNDERYFDMKTSTGNITWRDFTGMTASKKVGDMVVLPITSFSPGVAQMGAGQINDPMAFVRHDFEGTWKPESERHIGELIE